MKLQLAKYWILLTEIALLCFAVACISNKHSIPRFDCCGSIEITIKMERWRLVHSEKKKCVAFDIQIQDVRNSESIFEN